MHTRGESKKLTHLVVCGIISRQPIFGNKMLICPSSEVKYLPVKSLFGKLNHLFDKKLGKCWQEVCMRMRIPNSILVHDLLSIEI